MWNDGEIIARSFTQSYLLREDFPLNLKRVALAIDTKLDIEVIIEEYDNVPNEITAQLTYSDWVALILVNRYHSEHKKRFGIAHEFGHLLMDHQHGNLRPGSSEPDREKEEANNFAASLLMPAWHVLGLVKKYPDSLTFLVQKISSYFGVSLEASARRLAGTDFVPGLFALVDPNLGRLDWEYHSPSIRLDREAFREFLVRYYTKSKKREEDLEIMGYPFRIEAKHMWGKHLLTCMPFTIAALCARETAAGYGR